MNKGSLDKRTANNLLKTNNLLDIYRTRFYIPQGRRRGMTAKQFQ